MGLNKEGYQQLISQDIDWLKKQDNTLENRHIQQIVEDSINFYYRPEAENLPIPNDRECHHSWWWKIKDTVIGTICLKCRYKNKPN